jgi:putative ABC transport system substrate-binding protein
VLHVNAESDPAIQAIFAAFQREFRKLGWVDGLNIWIDYRWAGGEGSRMRPLAAELMAMEPEVMLACGTPAAVALQQMTRTIPIVFAGLPDPRAIGLVMRLAHPQFAP